jgi:hypothetical protein
MEVSMRTGRLGENVAGLTRTPLRSKEDVGRKTPKWLIGDWRGRVTEWDTKWDREWEWLSSGNVV